MHINSVFFELVSHYLDYMPYLQDPQPIVLFRGTRERIVFCLPGIQFSDKFLSCWSRLVSACQSKAMTVMLRQGYFSGGAWASRAKCLGVVPNIQASYIGEKPFGGVEYDFIMWIDSDQIFEPADFFRLLESPHSVTCGWYIDPYQNVMALQKENEDVTRSKLGDCSSWLKPSDIMKHAITSESPYIQLHTSGMGWFLMKKGIFERLQAPWFFFDENLKKLDRFHSFLSGEDSHLCDKVRSLQIDIMLDSRVHVGHEKSHIFHV